MKIDLSDVTFTIPVNVDSNDRLRNLRVVINYIKKYFFTNILIGEASPSPNIKSTYRNCGYIYYNTDIFHRTKLLNDLAMASCTAIVINCDADVLVDPLQISKAVNLIRSKKVDMVSPYAGKMVNIKAHKINELHHALNLFVIKAKDHELMNDNACGGILIWNKNSFMKYGMENENFIGWGCEDNERIIRAKKLGLEVHRMPGILYHLDHERTHDVTFGQEHYKENLAELEKVEKMNKENLEAYINTWKWR